MKQLHLIRHGEASFRSSSGKDKDRNLSPEGVQFIYQKASNPSFPVLDFALVSDANRTLETWKIILKEHHKTDWKKSSELYNASYRTLFAILEQAENKIENLGIIAHNPGLSELTQYLTGEMIYLEPGHSSQIRLDIESWSEVTKNSGELVRVFKN